MVRFTRIPSWSYPNITSHVPEHYYRHLQALKKPSTRVHDSKTPSDLLDFKYNDEIKRVERVADLPIQVIYPKEADLGLWGGEGVIKGYVKPRKYFQAGWPRPKYWFPNLKKVTLHSELLNKHFSFICTSRTLTLIDEHYGLDGYILRSNVEDLKSQLALLLRRKMLLTLINKEFIDENHEKEMLEKYQDLIIPKEEAEWFGLPPKEAIRKLKLDQAKNSVQLPLKYALTQQLLESLKNQTDDPESEPVQLGFFGKVKKTLGLSDAQ